MAHPVDRLKELLFDNEARALSDVQQRLTQSETRAEQERSEFANRLDAVFERAGTDERFGSAVAQVLDVALRKAEIDRHHQLSDAVAPLVVRTIKTEIVNSRDELVEALYPITGRMVKAYVASAISDLMAQINRRVDSNPVMLRLRSIMSGKSVAELALADANRPQVAELYLIRRGSGELVARWPEEAGSDRDHMMSGVLAAINEFASEAFANDGAALRQIDMGDARVYLRASPLYLLAAKCTGAAPVAAEGAIDSAFLSAIEQSEPATAVDGTQAPLVDPVSNSAQATRLARLSDELNASLAEFSAQEERSRISPARALLSVLGLIFVGVIGWYVLDRFFTERAHSAAVEVLDKTPAMRGYPVAIEVGHFGRGVTLTGLVPDEATKSQVLQTLQRDLPRTSVREQLSVLPGAHGEIGPAIERASITESLGHTVRRLEQVSADLGKLSAIDSTGTGNLERISQLVNSALRQLAERSHPLNSRIEDQAKLTEGLVTAANDLSPGGKPGRAPVAKPASNVPDSARDLAGAADRLAAVTAAAVQAASVKMSLPRAQPAVVRSPDVASFDRLSMYVRSHAIFFGDDVTYSNEAQATAVLDNLAKLMGETTNLIRVVGYTDGKGTSARNDELSAKRAEKVAQALIERGVPAQRLVHVGRQNSNQISNNIGEGSRNRRVEFEIGFDGEHVE